MNIIDALIARLPDGIPVHSVLAGVHWTVVCSRYCGTAVTLTSSHPHGHMQVGDVGRLHQKSARELAEFAGSTETMEASIGVAAINSMLDVDKSTAREINASEVLASRGWGKNVALIAAVFYNFRILDEEQACLHRYGKAYQNYMKHVPRYIYFF